MTHLEKLKKQMKEKNIPAAVITSAVNQRYISSFPFDDGYLLVTGDKCWLVTDFRYAEAAAEKADKGLEVAVPGGNPLGFVKEKTEELNIKTVMFEERTLAYGDLKRIEKVLEGAELVPGASAILDGLRLIKDGEEIEKMAKAQSITDAAFGHILECPVSDMTEKEVALELEFYMRKNGAEDVAFPTIAVSGRASSRPHGVPRDVKTERGFLTMDFGAKYEGYCSDMTRTVVIGKADAEMRRLYDTVLKAQRAAISEIREGLGCAFADSVARRIIDEAGYEGCFGHGLGHGVGMYIHEGSSLSPRAGKDARLREGEVVTVEPGIYIAGKYGCRIEDMVCVTADGLRNFTQSPKELIEIRA